MNFGLPNAFGASEEGGDDNSMWGVIGTALLGGLLSQQGQKDTNETNIQLGREQMGFQERMSNTAYQRAIKDMAAAGINPMLVSQVGGATSPSGSMPQIQNALGAGVAGAQQAAAVAAQYQSIQQSKAQTEQLDAQKDKIRSETISNGLHTAEAASRIEQSTASAHQLRQQAQLTSQQVLSESIRNENDLNQLKENLKNNVYKSDALRKVAESRIKELEINKGKAYSEYYDTPVGKSEPYVGLGAEVLSSAGGAKRAFGTQKSQVTRNVNIRTNPKD